MRLDPERGMQNPGAPESCTTNSANRVYRYSLNPLLLCNISSLKKGSAPGGIVMWSAGLAPALAFRNMERNASPCYRSRRSKLRLDKSGGEPPHSKKPRN